MGGGGVCGGGGVVSGKEKEVVLHFIYQEHIFNKENLPG